MREWFSVQAATEKGKGGGEILIYGVIGQSFWSEAKDRYVPAKAFVQELGKLVAAGPGDVHIRINSPGGDVWDGTAIYNAILEHRARCYCTIEGVAFSMASMIALAGRETRMYATSQYMLHNPRGGAWGEEKDLMQAVDGLRTARTALSIAYQNKSGQSAEAVAEMMSRTTWMTASQAKELGFVDVVLGEKDSKAEASGLRMAALHDVDGWRAYYDGRAPLPPAQAMDNEAQAGTAALPNSENPAVDSSAAGADEGGAGAAGIGAKTPEERGMKASEIRELCPDAGAEFVLAQVEASEKSETYGAVDVLKSWSAHQSKLLAEANAGKAAAEKAAAESLVKPTAPGVAPLAADGADAGDGDAGGDPVAAWDDLVAGYEKRGMPRAKAIREACVKHKAEYQAYLCAYNMANGRNHLAV